MLNGAAVRTGVMRQFGFMAALAFHGGEGGYFNDPSAFTLAHMADFVFR
jgi:hypothetical protein